MSIVRELIKNLKEHPENWRIGSYGNLMHEKIDIAIEGDGSIRTSNYTRPVSLNAVERWKIRRVMKSVMTLEMMMKR